MKISIVIAVLNSHEIVRRQIKYWSKLNLNDVEIIIVDDGSKPPLEFEGVKIHRTNDFRPWTQPEARNKGVSLAQGEWVICTDIDHIITKGIIDYVCGSSADNIRFKREVGVLDEDGNFTQDPEVMIQWGFPADRIARSGFKISPHGNSYAIKRDLFLSLGGSRQKDSYPNRDEVPLKQKLRQLSSEGKISIIDGDERPTIYMFPNGRFCGDKDYNPFGLFHTLSRA